MVGRLFSYWEGLFSGAMLVSGRVLFADYGRNKKLHVSTCRGCVWIRQNHQIYFFQFNDEVFHKGEMEHLDHPLFLMGLFWPDSVFFFWRTQLKVHSHHFPDNFGASNHRIHQEESNKQTKLVVEPTPLKNIKIFVKLDHLRRDPWWK